jgi:hypothetical protein
VWLFWASRRSGRWKIWFARSDGRSWGAPRQLTTGPRPDREPFVLFDGAGAGRLWVFWTRKSVAGLRNVFMRSTTNVDFASLTDADWTERENTPVPAAFDNREPAAVLGAGGAVELFVASNRTDGWNVWTRSLTVAGMGPESAVTTGQFTRRYPAPLRASPTLLRLFLRANDSQTHASADYPAATTIDGRYSGSTTLDLRNATKLSLRANLQDTQRYTYDARASATDADRTKQAGLYARGKVGVYLTPDTEDQALILRQRQLFANALRRFLPIQVDLVFLVDQASTEAIYGYQQPGSGAPLIGEQMIDTILSEVVPPGADAFDDRAPLVRFLRTWAPEALVTLLPDLSVVPPDLSARLFTKSFDEGA